MDSIGVFTPEQARLLWQDYQTRRQLQPHVTQNFPQRRQIDEVSPHRVFVKNDSGEEIPAYACLKITGTETVGGRTAITVDQPDSTTGEFLFNSQYAIAIDAVGWAYRFGIVVMLGDGETPTAANVQYRPVAATWTIEEGAGPFIVFGTHNVVTNALIGRFAGGGGSHQHGIVIEQLTRGYYRIRLSDWSAEELPDTVEEETLCEFLTAQVDIEGETYTDCDVNQDLPLFEDAEDVDTPHIVRRQTTAQDPVVEVLAFHRASIFVPLALWSEVLITDLGDSIIAESGSEKLYQIVDGFQEHLIAYDKEFECCETTGEWRLIRRTPYIFAAVSCVADDCEPCPVE
jgi:hypothetical protein